MLFQIVSRAEKPNVLGYKGSSAFRKGQHMIKMELFARSADRALPPVTLPHLKFHCRRNYSPPFRSEARGLLKILFTFNGHHLELED